MMEKFSCFRTTTKIFQSTRKHRLTGNQMLIHTMYATVKKTEISINKTQLFVMFNKIFSKPKTE